MSKQKLYKSIECKISTPVGLKSLPEQTKLVAINILGLLHVYIYIYIYIYIISSVRLKNQLEVYYKQAFDSYVNLPQALTITTHNFELLLSKPEEDSRKNRKLAYNKLRVDFSISHCLLFTFVEIQDRVS